jgi:hypothetical protein
MAYAMGYRSCAALRLDLPKNAFLPQSNHRRDSVARHYLAGHPDQAYRPLNEVLFLGGTHASGVLSANVDPVLSLSTPEACVPLKFTSLNISLLALDTH